MVLIKDNLGEQIQKKLVIMISTRMDASSIELFGDNIFKFASKILRMKETSQEDIEQINEYFQTTIGNDSA